MASKSILFIGAGVSGLCAGIYGQMNGYRTRILEQHTIPGGLLTAWKRKGYLIDLCTPWLTGVGPGMYLHRYWNEIGLAEGRQFLQFDRQCVYHGHDGRAVHLYADPERLEAHLLELSPQDAPAIHDLVEGLRSGIRFCVPEVEQYEAPVAKILVESGRAVGVRLADGSEQRADVVISAADGHSTISRLPEGQYADETIRRRYSDWRPMQAMIHASVGVNRTFPDMPSASEGHAFELQKPVTIAGQAQREIGVRILNYEPGFAPAGKTVLTSAILTDYAHWHALRAAYEAEKERVAQAYLGALEQVWPGISAQVEMISIAMPLTFERFTGNWQGSITGWKLTPQQGLATIDKTLPGLEDSWMVGQWVCPGGGLPAGVRTGREVIWRQCKKDRKRFTYPGCP